MSIFDLTYERALANECVIDLLHGARKPFLGGR